MREKWSCYFWASDCFAEFYTRIRLARRNPHTHIHVHRMKASYLYLLFLGGVRAQLKSLRESPLTCFATIIQPFQIQCSLPLPLGPPPVAIPERDILELKDILWTSNPRERKNSGSSRPIKTTFFSKREVYCVYLREKKLIFISQLFIY